MKLTYPLQHTWFSNHTFRAASEIEFAMHGWPADPPVGELAPFVLL
jgi:hypothetical protein